jgi:hypothetical protein
MGGSVAQLAGRTSKGKDVMSLAEVRPCHGEQRPNDATCERDS